MNLEKLNSMQDEVIDIILQKPKYILALEQGLGKSRVALLSYPQGALIICPTSLKYNWVEQILLHVKGCKEDEIEVVRHSKQKVISKRFVIVGYDLLHKVKLPKLKHLIVDEVQKIKSPKAIRSKQTARLMKQYEYVLALSGTPMLNRPIELWPLLTALGIIDMKFRDFGFRFCSGFMGPWGLDFRGSSNVEELRAILKPFIYRALKKDILTELPEKIYKVIALDFPLDQRESAFNLADIIHRNNPIAFEGLAELLKEQSLLKVPMTLDFVETLLENTEDKIILFGHHVEPLTILKQKLKKYNPAFINGSVKMSERQKEVFKFQNEVSCRLFIGNIAAAGTGFTLTKAGHVVFHETNWSYADIAQASDRAHRIGQDKQVQIHFLTIAKSIDCYMLKSILKKQKIIEQILD